MPYAYRKSERLRKNAEFIAAMKGKRLSTDGLSLFYSRNDAGNYRIGISVGKKLGNAVRRNQIRRRLRESIKRVIGARAEGYDLVFVARQGLAGKEFSDVLKAVARVIERSAVAGPGPEGSAR